MAHSKAHRVTHRAPVLIAARTWCTRANAYAEEDLVAAAAENFVLFLFRVTLSTRVFRIWHTAFATGFIASQAPRQVRWANATATPHIVQRDMWLTSHTLRFTELVKTDERAKGANVRSQRRGSEAPRDT